MSSVPQSARRVDDVQGHWLLARLGKRVLRPGGLELTMQTERGKRAIIEEAVRLLRPGGRYAIHELGLCPDDLDAAVGEEIRKDLARTIKVNARPLTASEWRRLLGEAGLEVEWSGTAPMALLQVRRNLADEGLGRVLRIAWNLLRDAGARRRVLAMRRTFVRHADRLTGIALIARKPA